MPIGGPCNECKFFHLVRKEKRSDGSTVEHGECHMHPPVTILGAGLQSVYPQTIEHYWCNDWRAKEEE